MAALAAPCVFFHWSCRQRCHPERGGTTRGETLAVQTPIPPGKFSHLESQVDETPHQPSRAQGKAVHTERGVYWRSSCSHSLPHSPKLSRRTQGHHSLPGVSQGDTGDKGTPAGPGTSPLAGTGWFGVPRIPCSVTTGNGRMQNVPPGMGTPLMGHQGDAEEGSLGMSWLKDL